MNFIKTLRERVLLGDGAMGTFLLSKGIRPQQTFEALSLTDPAIIRGVHEEYVAAGADLIETNSFGANRLRLAAAGYGSQAARINRAAAELARAAAGDKLFVAGSVGMIPEAIFRGGELYRPRPEEREEAYSEQIRALAEGGVDLIILETFEDWESLKIALRAAKKSSSLPVIAQMAFSNRGLSIFGGRAEDCCRRALSAGAAVFGSNCGGGFPAVETILQGASRVEGALLSAFSNAGMPLMSQGRMSYEAGPDYFASRSVELLQLGVRLIGGCCGTTPRHIRALRAALDREGIKPATARPKVAPFLTPPVRGEIEGGFLSSLRSDRLPVVVEIDPPFSPDMEKVVQGALALKNAGADAITMADNPLATLRVNSICAAAVVRRRARIQVISHLTARDHNVLGLQSLLMGADVLGIEGILAVTGDPAGKGDQPGTQGVFSVNSVHLVGLIDQLNRGHMLSGKAINRPTNFSIGVAFNANVPRLAAEVDRLRRKVDGGARFILTQPVFSKENAIQVLEACSGIEARVFIGILPLISSRNAEFLHNEVPGIFIPAPLRARLASLQTGEDQRRAGLDFAREMIEGIKDRVEGLYIISPLNKWTLARELVKGIREG